MWELQCKKISCKIGPFGASACTLRKFLYYYEFGLNLLPECPWKLMEKFPETPFFPETFRKLSGNFFNGNPWKSLMEIMEMTPK